MGPRRALVGLGVAGLILAGCGVPEAQLGPAGEVEETSESWRRLPAPPLSPRNFSIVVGVGDQMLVVGGWEFLCPPDADCMSPDGPWFRDGAVYDRRTDSWSPTAPAPFGLIREHHAATALDGSVYLLSDCADGPACDGARRLLSYDLAADRWTDHGPVPGDRPRHSRYLVPFGERLLVHSGSDEGGEVADLVFDPARASWAELPDDPLPRSYDRTLAPAGDQLVLAALPINPPGGESGRPAARFDPDTGRWARLPGAPGNAFGLLPTSRGVLLNGRFVDSPGWILDPTTWDWSELPTAAGADHDLSGVLDGDSAIYDVPNSVGEMTTTQRLLAYDAVTEAFVAIPALPPRADVYDDSSAALGRDLFVYGGQRWSGRGADAEGELVGDAWLWTAPTR